MAIADLLITDDLTILLGLIAITVFLLHNLYKQQPLVHPILLGRQSDVGRVRNPGESALYRNYGTGLMGRFAVRPEKDINLVSDLIKAEFDTPRTLWSTKISNPKLKARISAFGAGLVSVAKLVPQESNVLLLLNDSLEFIISDIALAANSVASFTLTSAKLLSPVLESHPPSAIITHAEFLPHVLELVYDAHESEHHTVIVVGAFDENIAAKAKGSINIVKWADVENAGFESTTTVIVHPKPEDVFTVSFFSSETGQLQGAHLTHKNITAGVSAIRGMFPLSSTLTSLDTITSVHSLSTAFGRTVAYTALFEGTSFATLDSANLFHLEKETQAYGTDDVLSATKSPIPSPTVLFLNPSHLHALSSAITGHAKKSFMYSFANGHKTSGIKDGFVSKDSLWDRLVFDAARSEVLGEGAKTIREIIVSGAPLDVVDVTPARLALSVPIVNAHIHPIAAGPIFASHPLDLQVIPAEGDTKNPFAHIAHVGPPSTNLEAKLVGVQDDSVERGSDPIGTLMIRGPTVGKVMGIGEESYIEIPSAIEDDGWVKTGETGRVLANGAFKILSVK